MKKSFIDTNIILRFLLSNHPTQSVQAKTLFTLAEKGKIQLVVSDAVILELVWTLESFYKLKRQSIREKLTGLLSLPHVSTPSKERIVDALSLYAEKKVDFVDAYNFLFAKDNRLGILSFDRGFDKLGKREDVKRVVGE